jgi:spermidine/putrescine transport system permease protein
LAKRKCGVVGAMNIVRSVKDFFAREIMLWSVMPALLWQGFFFLAPLVFIFLLSFVVQSSSLGITFYYYINLFSHAVYYKIIFKSLFLALRTAFLCLCVGYPLAYYIAFNVKKFKNLYLFFLIVPFWTNFLVQVYAWFFVLERNGFLNNFLLYLGFVKEPFLLLNSSFAVSLVMFYCYLPFMVMPIYTVLEKFDTSLLDASHDLGASNFQTFIQVVLPLSLSGIRTGFFLVFVPAFSEFVIPMLVGGDKTMYSGGLVTYYFLTAQNRPMGAAFTVVSSIVLLIMISLINMYMRSLVRSTYKG